MTLLQFTELTLLVFCCRFQPVEGEGQETATVLVVVRKMESNGAPGVCTAAMMPQKPPCERVVAAAHRAGVRLADGAADGIDAAGARAAAAVYRGPVNGIWLGLDGHGPGRPGHYREYSFHR